MASIIGSGRFGGGRSGYVSFLWELLRSRKTNAYALNMKRDYGAAFARDNRWHLVRPVERVRQMEGSVDLLYFDFELVFIA